MSHRDELVAQAKRMLAEKYFCQSPLIEERDDGQIVVGLEFSILTDDRLQTIKNLMMMRCSNTRILFRSKMQQDVPKNAYDQIVQLITEVNSVQGIACFEFDYSDGELTARTILRCSDFVPSTEMIFTLLFNANSMFMKYGDRILDIINAANNVHVEEKVQMPIVEDRETITSLAIEKVRAFLNSPEGFYIADRDLYFNKMNSIHNAMAGNIDECSFLPELLFLNERLPQLFDPKLAYYFFGWGRVYTNDNNWYLMGNVPGESKQGVIDCFCRKADQTVLMFGTPQQKAAALRNLCAYVDKYWGADDLPVEELVYALMGMAPYKVARNLGITIGDELVDRERAINYYKRRIDDCLERGIAYKARDLYLEVEALLGIDYYNSRMQNSQQPSATPARKPVYEAPQPQQKQGCYIATCVYGSYDCPEVWTLRRFRDEYLANSVFGRMFIRTYYAVSPTLVRWFGENRLFRNSWRKFLDPMVSRLNRDGYSDTPYDDQ